MKKGLRAKLLIAAALAVFASLCGGCGSKEYWPLEKGNYWVYGVRAGDGFVISDTVFTVKSVKREKGKKTALIRVSASEKGAPLSETIVVSTPKGLYETRRARFRRMDYALVRNELLFSTTSPFYIIKGRPRAGREWSFTGTVTDKSSGKSSEIRGKGRVEARESLSMAAGNFHAYRTQWFLVDASGDFSEERTYWFKRGVGPIKIEEYAAAGRMVLNLKKAKIGSKKIGQW